MQISAELVRALREQTSAGMMDCKKALMESQGDFTKAIEWLRKKGLSAAEKKLGRETKEGAVYAYIHGDGKIGVMLEMNCETDFVARTDRFKALLKDVALHIAASAPRYVGAFEVPAEIIGSEKAIAEAQLAKIPPAAQEKAIQGKLAKFYEETCLLQQRFVKDQDKTIEQVIKEAVATLGENIAITRFVRFSLGEKKSETPV